MDSATRQIESSYKCLRSDGDGNAGGASASNYEVFAKYYGWLHTLNLVIENTAGVTREEVLYKWTMKEFLNQLQYMSDKDGAERRDYKLEEMKRNARSR